MDKCKCGAIFDKYPVAWVCPECEVLEPVRQDNFCKEKGVPTHIYYKIRKERRSGDKLPELCERYGLEIGTIREIVYNKKGMR